MSLFESRVTFDGKTGFLNSVTRTCPVIQLEQGITYNAQPALLQAEAFQAGGLRAKCGSLKSPLGVQSQREELKENWSDELKQSFTVLTWARQAGKGNSNFLQLLL